MKIDQEQKLFLQLFAPAPAAQSEHQTLIFCENEGHLAALRSADLGWSRNNALIFVSDGTTQNKATVPVAGDIESGDIEVGEQHIALIDYASSEFVPIIGPTFLRLCESEDLEAFAADADYARQTGQFPRSLISANVMFVDYCTLMPGFECNSQDLNRLFVDDEGVVRASLSGASLCHVSDGFEAARNAAEAMSCSERCLGDAVDSSLIEAIMQERPWIPQYLIAVSAIRNAVVSQQDSAESAELVGDLVLPSVSGFGGRISDSLAGRHYESTEPSVIVVSDSDALAIRSDGSSCRVGRDAALLIEAFNVTGSVQDSVDLLALEHSAEPQELTPQVVAAIESFRSLLLVRA